MNKTNAKSWLLFVSVLFLALTANGQPRILESAMDSAITLQVKTALTTNPITKSRHIHVSTHRGYVYLSGAVDSRAEARTAKQVALSVPGVRSVNIRDIAVKHSRQAKIDYYITQDIKSKLRAYRLIENPRYPDLVIHVETRNGNVYLTGNIVYDSQGERAIDIARESEGVKEVYYNFKKNRY